MYALSQDQSESERKFHEETEVLWKDHDEVFPIDEQNWGLQEVTWQWQGQPMYILTFMERIQYINALVESRSFGM